MRRTLIWIGVVGLFFAAMFGGRSSQAETRSTSAEQRVGTLAAGRTRAVVAPVSARTTVASKDIASLKPAATLLPSRNLTTLIRRFVITLFVVAIAMLLLVGIRRVKQHLIEVLDKKRHEIPSFRFRGLELVSAQTLFRNLGRIASGAYVMIVAMVVLGTSLIIFSQFPATQGYARQVGYWVWNPIVAIVYGMLGYLPNLFYILVILVVVRFILRMITYIFRAAERGLISLEPWVQQDVARPTGLIIRVVIVVVGLFFIAPLIPGTGSTAAKGISIILGLMISFGSTSTVGNFVAGIVLMYMRPFQITERVKIGDTVGDVIERTFLYTKVLTIKNEEVIVPSLIALGSPLINYSSRARTQGLVLHTSVTIGYDVPWRQVHELLQSAAARTSHVAKEPEPYVLQTALDDSYVKYQINVHTDQASKMALIYSELHQNIQDVFNEARVEICSPHFRQVRDGNSTTVPVEYRPKDYKPPRFRVETVAAASEE